MQDIDTKKESLPDYDKDAQLLADFLEEGEEDLLILDKALHEAYKNK